VDNVDTEIMNNHVEKITHIVVHVPIAVTCHFTSNNVEQLL